MFGYLVKYPIRIDELKQHLSDAKITLVEQRPDRIALHDCAGNRVYAHVSENEVKFFWRTAGNDASVIMQKIADCFEQDVFSDLPEYHGDNPIYITDKLGNSIR